MFSPLSSQPLPARQSPPSHELADIQSGADEEAQVLRYQDWDDEGEMADASRTLSGSSRRTGVVRGLQRLFGWTAWRKVPTHGAAPIEDEDSNDPLLAGVLSEPTRPSSSAKSTSSVELTMTGNERRPAHPARTEHALLRCFALAAAVTTWCLLQPFILFFLAAHFKNHYVRAYTGSVGIFVLLLSMIVGMIVGPRAVCEVLRILDTGEPPSRRRASIFGILLAVAIFMALMPILLCLHGT